MYSFLEYITNNEKLKLADLEVQISSNCVDIVVVS